MGAAEVQSLFQEKVKVGFWRWVVRWSKGSCFISTKVNPWHSQTTNRSIRDHFSFKQNHQGPSQRHLTNIWKNPKFGRYQWGGRWVGGDWSTFRNCFETKFPEAQHEQRVLSQKMGSYNPKLSESFCRCNGSPIIISGKVVKAVGWFGGQMSNVPKCSGLKFPRSHIGQGVLSQKIASQKFKNGRVVLRVQQRSSHYFRKKSKLAIGW